MGRGKAGLSPHLLLRANKSAYIPKKIAANIVLTAHFRALDGMGGIGETYGYMTMAKILEEVGQLPASERRELAALIVAKYPPRSVEELVSRAEREAQQGKWVPTPPTADNIPTGEALAQALGRAKKLGIAR